MPVNGTMQTEKLFEFSDPRHSAEDENLKVTIVETIDAHYSLYVWPCAVVLAQYLWCNRSKLLTGKHVLELGAGTALPSIVAAMCGKPASVTITDDESCLQCFENCRRSLRLNGLNRVSDLLSDRETSSQASIHSTSDCTIHLMGLKWGQVNPHLAAMALEVDVSALPLPDFVLGSDCFYDEDLFEEVISTVYYLLKSRANQNPKAKPAFLCTYQVRCRDWSISDLLYRWGLAYEDIPLSSFGADGHSLAGSKLPGAHKIEMMRITLS